MSTITHNLKIRCLLNAFAFILTFSFSEIISANESFIPKTISKEAAAFLKGRKPVPLDAHSSAEWEAIWKNREAGREQFVELAFKEYPAKVESITIAGQDHLIITPDSYNEDNQNKLLVYVHGGAHVLFSPRSTLVSSLPAAHYSNSKVLSIKYPLAWEQPYPAARNVIVEVYKELLKSYRAKNIVIYGDSAGGGMVLSAIQELYANNVDLPAAVGLLSPWVDATKTGDSLTILSGHDPILDYEKVLKNPVLLYAGHTALEDSGISPINADYSRNFPPTFISTGTRDLFLSHCARLQRVLKDANIDVELVLYEGMWHVFQGLRIPEEKSAWKDMIKFIDKYWGE